MLRVTQEEYKVLIKYIEEHCGIHLQEGKEYLIESRLSDLVVESGQKSFQAFYHTVRNDRSGRLKERIIDAMTTNETSWFRDGNSWKYVKEVFIPRIFEKASQQKKVRIWSAAAATGQEAYSLLMLLHEEAENRKNPSILEKIEILATDISSSALFQAISARYGNVSMGRGLPEDKKMKYFKQDGNMWVFNQELKKRVQFKRFNLQDNFILLGSFDLIFCRYVMIYFSDNFRSEIVNKIAGSLINGGILLVEGSMLVQDYSNAFQTISHENSFVNIKK